MVVLVMRQLSSRTLMRIARAIDEGRGDFADADTWALGQEAPGQLEVLTELGQTCSAVGVIRWLSYFLDGARCRISLTAKSAGDR